MVKKKKKGNLFLKLSLTQLITFGGIKVPEKCPNQLNMEFPKRNI